jgi:cytochrome c556
LLREHFTEALRLDEVQQQPTAFRELMKQAENHAQALEDEFRAWESARPPAGRKKLDAALAAVTQNCTACHKQFRDVPLQQKGKQ